MEEDILLRSTIFGQFLLNPLNTGALCASSTFLSKEITKHIGIEKAKSIVELGSGTGAVTRHIVDSVHNNTAFFAVELNPDIYNAFKTRFPKVKVYNRCASELPEIVKGEGLGHGVDIIISGLPWASFSDKLQDSLLDAVMQSLRPGGVFTTFAYLQGTILPTGIKFKHRLRKHFSEVHKSRVVWANIPPAFVYRCRK